MSCLDYNKFTVEELKKLLNNEGVRGISKLNKQELVRRLQRRETLPNLQKSLFEVEVIGPDADFVFPNDGFKDLLNLEDKKLTNFTEDSFRVWFQKRLSLTSMKNGRILGIRQFVKCIQFVEPQDSQLLFFKALCSAQTTKNVDYKLKLVLQSHVVVQAQCECPAGSGWSVTCKHVSALCYNLEHYGLTGKSLELVSKTSLPQQWGKPTQGRQVGCLRADQIAGTSLSVGRTIRQSRGEALKGMLKTMESGSPWLSKPSWFQEGSSACGNTLEERTRGQANNSEWTSARKKMITGSIVYDILRTVESGNFVDGPARKQQQPLKLDHIPAVKWGRQKEKVAIKAYEQIMGIKVKPCGLFQCKEREYFGATPDGISEDSRTLIEVKCPHSVRFKPPMESNFVSSGGKIVKKQYYAQVQSQMIVTGIEKCDFVVWTTKGLLIQSVSINRRFKERLINAVE